MIGTLPTRQTGFSRLLADLKYLMTGRYSLVVFDGFPGYGDLFDLKEDPNELNNLWDKEPELRA